jgi:4-hydroxy-2-oxoheptanedioate aldolase
MRDANDHPDVRKEMPMFGPVSVRKRLEARQVQFGLFLDLGSVAAAEIAGHVGYDVLLLDQEHSPYIFENAIHCMNAARGTGAECWVRIPASDVAYVKRILDSGADGIMCPMINTAEEARQFVSFCRYAPLGIRGYAPTICRYNSYGYHREEYSRRVTEDLSIMVQIETREAVENAERIAAVEGVNIVFIGPADLSNSLGFPGQFNHPTVMSAFQCVEDAVLRSGKVLGTMLMPGQEVGALIQRRYGFIVTGADLGIMRAGMEAQMKILKETLAKVGHQRNAD